jgi:hypothetical protein
VDNSEKGGSKDASLSFRDKAPSSKYDSVGSVGRFNGIADLNDNTPRPPDVVTPINHHTVLQAAEFLRGDVSVNGAQGDEDQYWRNFAVMSLVMKMRQMEYQTSF